jgi:hypothetical protein
MNYQELKSSPVKNNIEISRRKMNQTLGLGLGLAPLPSFVNAK